MVKVASHKDTSIFELYEIGDIIGAGNFGQVRKCICREFGFDKDLCVKVVELDSEQALRTEAFRAAKDEVEIMDRIQHDNIVEILDMFEDHSYLYVIMEQVRGGELFKAISDKSVIVLEADLSRVALQLFQAIAYLHLSGIVHRDIKAQNILLTEVPQASGRVLQSANIKVIDFGLAAVFKRECCGGERPLDLMCGTPAMCAPEIWAIDETSPNEWKDLYGESYGANVDVWAAGVVLFLALFGRLPFFAKNRVDLAAKVCNPLEEPSFKPRTGASFVSKECKAFLCKTLSKKQSERISSAKAAKDDWLCHRLSGSHRGKPLRRTRSKSFDAEKPIGSEEPIPADVLEAARIEAENAVLQHRQVLTIAELAERTSAFATHKEHVLAGLDEASDTESELSVS